MRSDISVYETQKYRSIVYQNKTTEDIFLTTCGIENCNPGRCFYAQNREGYHMHMILSGKGVLSVNGKEKKLCFGNLFVTKPGEDTWYKADEEDPWIYCWMAYDGKNAREYTENAGFVDGVNHLIGSIDPEHFYFLCKNVLDLTEVSKANLLMRTGLLLEYLSLAVDSYNRTDTPSNKSVEVPTETYVKYAADYIRVNYATAKVSDVAKYIGIHRSYLTSIFKAKMGVSPQEYLIQCKVKQAASLLINTDNPIQEISHQIGYDNPLTFSKSFKNFYGVSPKHYRDQNKQKYDISAK